MGRLQRANRPPVQGGKGVLVMRRLPLGYRWPWAFSLILAAGCSGLDQSAGIDPLLGGPPLRPSPVAAPPPPNPVAALPPASANSTLSNAALAAGSPQPADNGLRIASPRGSAGNDGWAREGSPSPNPDSMLRATADGRGAVLRAPEPVSDPGPRGQLTTASNPGSMQQNRASTFEDAERQIAARGALWQRLESVGASGGWKYSCSIPNRQNPRIRRTYEATATDPSTAIRAVLEQLDKEP
jgi:hypothetical protein